MRDFNVTETTSKNVLVLTVHKRKLMKNNVFNDMMSQIQALFKCTENM